MNYTKKISEIDRKINNLTENLSDNNDESMILDFKFQMQKIKIEELTKEKDILFKKIAKIESNENDIEYHVNTLPILEQYYSSEGTNYVEEEKSNVIDVMSMFINNGSSSSSGASSSATESTSKSTSGKQQQSSVVNKADLFNSYMNIVDPESIKNFKNESSGIESNICNKCKSEMTIYSDEGICICKRCGKAELVVIDSERPNYKDPPMEIGYFAYKRINHFNEWLAQFQAKESTDIPQDVLNQILNEIKKERISNMALIDNKKMREFLKRLKLNKYYEHIPHIINRLNGRPPMVMSRDLEETLRTMFKEIQAPFLKHCPKERKNFLSYSYVLHKFVQLLGLDEFIPCFSLLKSREKLHNQDLIWQKICMDLNWQFIKSI